MVSVFLIRHFVVLFAEQLEAGLGNRAVIEDPLVFSISSRAALIPTAGR